MEKESLAAFQKRGGKLGRIVCNRGKRGSEAVDTPDEGAVGKVSRDLGEVSKRMYRGLQAPSEATRSVGPEESDGQGGPALTVKPFEIQYRLRSVWDEEGRGSTYLLTMDEFDFFSSICIQRELSQEKYGDPKKGPQAIEAMTAVDPYFIYGIILKYLLRIKNRGAERFDTEDLAKVGRYTLLLRNQLSKALELLAKPAGR
jgi:hypothetical protein